MNAEHYAPIITTNACQTKDIPSRCELTGRLENGRMIHIVAATAKSHGPGFAKFVRDLAQRIKEHKMCKAETVEVIHKHRV